jgi:amidase
MKKLFLINLTFICLASSAQLHKKINFTPTQYYSYFSGAIPPALHIKAGDTIVTSSIDCEGFDKNSIQVIKAINPLTGPFYVEGAEEGDIIKVKFTDIQFSRNTAICLPYFHPRSMHDSTTKLASNDTVALTWNLDFKTKTASLKEKTEHLKNYKVDIEPFFGCVGLAAPKDQIISTADAGITGGNMDFNRIKKNASVYLPVYNKGGLLYIGDGHAQQGDGEINLSALETSLDYSFVTELIKKPAKQITYPRVEDAEYIMTIGLDASLDNALKIANKGMLDWLQETYDLSIIEATQVMGTALEYKITEIVDPKVEIVAMIKKKTLAGIKKN